MEEQEEKIPPYKSYRKKYRKMERVFNEKMALSDELHAQDVQAKKIFNRILRQKTLLSDLLLRMNTDHLDETLRVGIDDEQAAPEPKELTQFGEHYKRLLEESFEYSSDERSQPPVRNPVGLLEWLKRNQPSVLQPEQVLERPTTLATKKKAAGKSGNARKRKVSEEGDEAYKRKKTK